ncbi:hypothetical protein [Bizionia myxarmorum]|uniref:Uncharacterized protein n=1 Tax=Bizionia myxarmorum TaxID=291186 RepID=A0A5D0R691_9FLAO|nr:hypothetical protein [Bizionia myxarmorum]TYB76188.1 hypothetical protein ES674_11365 [Bizionia myxarmorum]
MKSEKTSFKSRLIFGLVAGFFSGFGIFLWDFFEEEPIVIEKYVFQAVFTGLFMALAFGYKVDKKNEP